MAAHILHLSLLFRVDSLPKKYSKALVQKKAIAEHRSFSLQNAFSIAIFIQFLGFCACLAIDALSLPAR